MNVKPQTSTVFIIHSADENVILFQNSIRYFEALKKVKVMAEIHIYERGGQSNGLVNGRNSSEFKLSKACNVWSMGRD